MPNKHPKNPKVAALVRRELQRHPDVTNAALLERAASVDPALTRMDRRVFQTTYRVPEASKLRREAKALADRVAANVAAHAEAHAAEAEAPINDPADAPVEAVPVETPAPAPASNGSTAVALYGQAQRDAVRAMLHDLVREALRADSRASVLRVLDLEERAIQTVLDVARH